MKKVYAFCTSLMNGTVTMATEMAVFGNRQLAEKTRHDLMEYNSRKVIPPAVCICSKVTEMTIYEREDEIPFYQMLKGGAE